MIVGEPESTKIKMIWTTKTISN